ncbi:MAG: hypothetical protein E7672_01250 [Ruminococcaceae bacterium]|nr:hypothetical protein [Oscillospiraceae bacterium]
MADIIAEVYGGMFDSTSVEETAGGFPRGNKAVDSSFFAKMISCFYKDGIFGDDSFKITPDAGLSVKISAGIAWIRGYMAWQRSDTILTLADGGTYAIVLRLNTATGEFNLIGTENISGVPQNTNNIKDLVLAYVAIPSSTVALSESMITDKRHDSTVCGVVTSTVDALGYVANAENANMLGGQSAEDFLQKSGGTMRGTLKAASDTLGAQVVRNIGYGSSVPASLEEGELFILVE